MPFDLTSWIDPIIPPLFYRCVVPDSRGIDEENATNFLADKIRHQKTDSTGSGDSGISDSSADRYSSSSIEMHPDPHKTTKSLQLNEIKPQYTEDLQEPYNEKLQKQSIEECPKVRIEKLRESFFKSTTEGRHHKTDSTGSGDSGISDFSAGSSSSSIEMCPDPDITSNLSQYTEELPKPYYEKLHQKQCIKIKKLRESLFSNFTTEGRYLKTNSTGSSDSGFSDGSSVPSTPSTEMGPELYKIIENENEKAHLYDFTSDKSKMKLNWMNPNQNYIENFATV